MHVSNLASAGETSEWGLANIDRVIGEDPDVVLVEFAANDAALDRFITRSGSRANMTALIDTLAMALPRARLYVQAMNPAWGSRGWLRPFLDSYVDDHLSLAGDLKAGIIDHRPYWASKTDEALRAAIPDGIHPRADLVAEDIAAVIAQRLCADLREPT